MGREELSFTSGGERCAAWRYGDGPTCVVMANGFSLTRHDGLPHYAEALAEAGASVLVFDHRHLGDSGGERRQRFRSAEQLEDWRNAIAYARGLDGVQRIVLWGFSFSGGHVVKLAAQDGAGLAAALVHAPFLDGLARVLATRPGLVAWMLPRALADLAGRHTLIPVTAEPGGRGAMSLPGEAAGFAASVGPGSPWRNEISPGVFATIALHKPVARAGRISIPLWVGVGERDITVSAAAVERLAQRAPDAELHRYPLDHFEPLLAAGARRIADDQVGFLRRRGLL